MMPLVLFFVAMVLKFVVNDNGLHRLPKEGYDQKGRWILAAAVFVGWGISTFSKLPETVPAFLQAFLAGGVLLNVLKEELPKAGKSNYRAFAIGGLTYAVLLIILATQKSGG